MLHAVYPASFDCSPIKPEVFGWQDCPPNYDYYCNVPRGFWLIHYVVRGHGSFQYKDREYHLGPGELFIIEPHTPHHYIADNEQPWEYIFFGFFIDGDQIPACLYEPVIRCPEAHRVFEDMKKSGEILGGRSAFLAARCWDLISLLQEQSNSKVHYIDQAIELMRAEYAGGITVQELADRLHLSRSHFFTLFKKKNSCSPQQYLIRLRLEKAAELLRKDGASPSYAAYSVGYTDIFQFSRAFKKHFGVSPRNYKKNG